MNNTITHSGVIESISQNRITVRFVQVSACASCKVSGQCHASDQREKTVEIVSADASAYQVGEHVEVVADTGVGRRAVWWAFVLPLLLFLGSLFVVASVTGNETWGVLAAIFMLVVYYGVLHLLRDRIGRTLAFTLQKQLQPQDLSSAASAG